MKTKNKILLGLGATVALVGSAGVESFASELTGSTNTTASYQATGKFVQKIEYVSKTIYDGTTKTSKTIYIGQPAYYFLTGSQLIPLAKNDADVVRKYGTTQTVTVFGKVTYQNGKPLLDVDAVRVLPTEERFTGKIIELAKYEVRTVYDARTHATQRIYVKIPEFYFLTPTKMYKLADNDRAVAYKYGAGKTLTVTGKVLNGTSYPVLDIDKVLTVTTLPVK